MLINGGEFFEDVSSRRTPILRFASENAAAQRSLYVTAPGLILEDLIAAAQCLLGYAVVGSDNKGPAGATRRWISRTLPAAFPAVTTPDNPSARPYLWCTSIPSAEPASAPAGVDFGFPEADVTRYDWYRFSCIHETLPYDLFEDDEVLAQVGPLAGTETAPAEPDEGDALRRGWINTRYVVRQVDGGSRTIETRSIVQWAADGGFPAAGIAEGLPFTEFRANVKYVWLAVPYDGVNFSLINQSYGCVNAGTFDGFPEGTLLLLNGRQRKYRSAFGMRLVDYTFEMLFCPHFDEPIQTSMGWNSLLRVVAGQKRFWPISADGTLPGSGAAAGVNLFPYVSFPALFRPPQG